jgi:uncharacterized membrane protein YhaH (DUF805 family)
VDASTTKACKYRLAAHDGIVRLNTFSVLLVTRIFPFVTIAVLRLRDSALMEWQLLSFAIKLRGFMNASAQYS